MPSESTDSMLRRSARKTRSVIITGLSFPVRFCIVWFQWRLQAAEKQWPWMTR